MGLEIHTLPIKRTVDEAPGVRTFLFDIPEGFTWKPGAHIHAAIPGFNEGDTPNRELVRHMSVSTLPEEDALGFTTRLDSSDSQFKRTISGYGPGDELAFFKCGSILGLPDDGRPVVLLSQGVGIASMRPLLVSYARRVGAGELGGTPSVTSITVDAAPAGIFEDELSTLDARDLSIRRVAHRAEFNDAVRALPHPADSLFEVVGSDAFLRSAIALLRTLGVPDTSIVLDKKEAKRAPFFA